MSHCSAEKQVNNYIKNNNFAYCAFSKINMQIFAKLSLIRRGIIILSPFLKIERSSFVNL